ncbi:hypothetical protein CRI77_05440 [Mycolicibacterium duvalii]|uniref:Uncharacterized protein n=1 Tax=Mycolicibacterium duvalii TaxID=39688 RepID=A0A7I7K049_9MYCO|nr:DUF427 domain-containing protein [Mycolicibacterium duvalii]MCV7370231.1 DUF427 domain-containing protein [Mycolicibacterium duvalii]PEG43604.1 hypothetical protein CRI77_05440 [Mycolicibacterium duvalii]BBX17403.1 hypothetical protein MDUV_22630 [Mycolicibacterium duvalii]
MSLVVGHGPLSAERAGVLIPPVRGDLVYIEPHPRRIEAYRGDQRVLETERALMVHRRGDVLRYAFQVDDIGDLPADPVPEAPGYVTVPWDAVDRWCEEGRQLVHYPPNPYHRVDCRPTTRRLRVTVAGATLVDTTDTVILFETALAPRLYVAPSAVRTDLLAPSSTTSYCNYKGYATYYHATIDGHVVEDAAWSYQDPLPESQAIASLLSFDATRVDVEAELPRAEPDSDRTGTGGDFVR